MLFKPRTKPSELELLELLNPRMKLSAEDEKRLLTLSKGYEGELLFDRHFEALENESLVLNSLLFEVNNTTFQVDSLIILNNQIHFYEIKFFEGDYYYQDNKLFKKPKFEVINPLHQLGRSESLLKQLLLSIGFNPKIISNVIFVHPNFTLYEAPLHLPFIFPTQIKRHIEELNKLPAKISNRHMDLAKKLVEIQVEESRFMKVPDYSIDTLKKGLCCSECGTLSVVVEKYHCVCGICGKRESMSAMILEAANHFQILFPHEKLRTSILYEWCGKLISKKTIGRVLNDHYNRKGVRQWTYYE